MVSTRRLVLRPDNLPPRQPRKNRLGRIRNEIYLACFGDLRALGERVDVVELAGAVGAEGAEGEAGLPAVDAALFGGEAEDAVAAVLDAPQDRGDAAPGVGHGVGAVDHHRDAARRVAERQVVGAAEAGEGEQTAAEPDDEGFHRALLVPNWVSCDLRYPNPSPTQSWTTVGFDTDEHRWTGITNKKKSS